MFGCSQPSSASGAALSSTLPAGSCTGSVPIATATKKSALRSQISRVPGFHSPGAAVVRAEDLPSRAQLHQMFLEAEGLTYETVELEKHATESGYRLTDRELADRWRNFLQEHLSGLAIVLRRES